MVNRHALLIRKAAVVTFTVATALLGAMILPTILWMFTFGLIPPWVFNVLALPAGAFTGYWGFQYTAYNDWLSVDET
jgi:hypothetical protein